MKLTIILWRIKMDTKKANKIIRSLGDLTDMEMVFVLNLNEILLHPKHPNSFNSNNLPLILHICKRNNCLFITRYNKIKNNLEGVIF